MKTKEAAKAVLDAADIDADYLMVITDTGPGVEIRVDPKQFGLATTALPFTIGGATVKFSKRPKK